jgi:hypothetical protein
MHHSEPHARPSRAPSPDVRGDRHRSWTRWVAAAILLAALTQVGCGGTKDARRSQSSAIPVLGHRWGAGQAGYGLVRPTRIFNGGDPTGLVEHIRWSSWGGPIAVGTGTAEYVWPGTSVASNANTTPARVIAYHKGTCRGLTAYTAVTWYFPQYGETFNPKTPTYNICTGSFPDATAAASAHPAACPDVTVVGSTTPATSVQVVRATCDAAAQLIASLPVERYRHAGGRFTHGRFRCGTQGDSSLDTAIFECSDGQQDLLFNIDL